MEKWPFLLLFLFLLGCNEENYNDLKTGSWHGSFKVKDEVELPFQFELSKHGRNGYYITFKNAEERVMADEVWTLQDSIVIRMPVFEGYLAGNFTSNRIEGHFIKESLDRRLPFTAKFGERPRFKTNNSPKVNVSGKWETTFEVGTETAYAAIGMFEQKGDKVTGTFRTTTGDYRYLEGVVDGKRLKLSTFDGAHVFLFEATVEDGKMEGTFYSGNHYESKFMAHLNPGYELPNAHSLNYIKEGEGPFNFSFPNGNGTEVSLKDPYFQNKVTVVQIMGTWCPNCVDETKYYVNYLKDNPNSDLRFVALAFEYAKTEEKALGSIKRFKERLGVNYPVLLAQTGTSSKTKAAEKLPMLNAVLSYPTTIFIDKKGGVRKIHTGFNGPATGEKYKEFQRGFENTLNELLEE